ncbi:MAG: N-acetyltransferase [Desulfovibrio sp.]|nr:N-acetyltransferase [Desulfovibrio sp.]
MIQPAFRYKVVTDPAVRSGLYTRMMSEGLGEFACPAGNMTPERWMELTEPRDGNIFGVSLDPFGNYCGMATFTRREYRMWRFDFTAFRRGFEDAVRQARGAFQWVFGMTDATALYGITPAVFRHSVNLATACGFAVVSRLPSACWLARRNRYVDGVLVICTRQTLEDSDMGFNAGGGGASVPEVKPTPKAEVTKPVTEAATAARQSQKDKAAKAAGLRSTILTGEGALGNGNNQGKTLLGQ